MSYWFDQPVNVDKSQNVEIHNIIIDPSTPKTTIPKCFEFKTVTSRHYKIIHAFLCKNYIRDKLNIVKLIYHEDFIYWYLKNVSLNFALALIYEKNIIGFITALFIQVEIHGKIVDMPYINFLCVDKKLRNCNLGPLLIDEIKKRICQKGINHALFTSMSNPTSHFCTSDEYIIPINFDKLVKIGFITDVE
ncbi:MAG: GNAT family N-acetyltransferase, partial [Rickettsiales bacterium]